jgi:hypothetical protein
MINSARTLRQLTSSHSFNPLPSASFYPVKSSTRTTAVSCQTQLYPEWSSTSTSATSIGSSRRHRSLTRRGRRIGVDVGGLCWRGYATGQAGLKPSAEEEAGPGPTISHEQEQQTKVESQGDVPLATKRADQTVDDITVDDIHNLQSNSKKNGTDPSKSPSPDKLVRPTISPSHVPFLPASPLNQAVPPYPPVASSVIREAIADFLSAEKSLHVLPVPQEIYDKKSYFGWRVFYWRTKQLFKFYWAGCKCLWSNYLHVRTLRTGVKRDGWELTRREKKFISRTKADLWKIVPFVFFLMTLEEILPLMVLFTPWLLPSTTVLPSQFLRIKSAEEIKRREGLLKVGEEVKRSKLENERAAESNVKVGSETMTVVTNSGQPIYSSLHPVMMDGLCRALDLGTMAPRFWLRQRLDRRIRSVLVSVIHRVL